MPNTSAQLYYSVQVNAMADGRHIPNDLDRVQSTWNAEEYKAGYAARLHEEAESVTATPGWRSGWHDADREQTCTQHDEGSVEAQYPLRFFGSGGQARRCGLPFDAFSSYEWKQEWIEIDLAIGWAEQKLRSRSGKVPARQQQQGGPKPAL